MRCHWIAVCFSLVPLMLHTSTLQGGQEILAGFAETDITPPVGFPMAGYFHERLAEGAIDPLKAKAVVFRSGDQQAAFVICDLIAASADFTIEVRSRASAETGIPPQNIVVSATHSHTAPDYSKSLYAFLRSKDQTSQSETGRLRMTYIASLLDQTAQAIILAHRAAAPVTLASASLEQQVPVAFNRRFVQRDGSVRTWVGLEHPDSVRSAGPIDPEIGLLMVRDQQGVPKSLISNFALHLDTVGGSKWSADYPYFISQAVQKVLGPDVVSVFGTGCCGDINHVNPRGQDRNKTDFIGNALGTTITEGLTHLTEIDEPRLEVRTGVVRLPLQDASADDIAKDVQTMKAARAGTAVDFVDHVTAHRRLMIDQLRNVPRHAQGDDAATALMMTSHWEGVGDSLPAEVQVIAFGKDAAIVFLPGEVFVELGLAIKRGSPYRTTMVIELSSCVETFYVPTRAAFAGGGYEVTNSTLKPGGGEMLVEEALRLLRSAASASH
jgi:neutral ceramidase